MVLQLEFYNLKFRNYDFYNHIIIIVFFFKK